METTNSITISEMRERVQIYVDKKNNYLKDKGVEILSALELNDDKRLTNAYKLAVDKNNEAIDLIMDIKSEILNLKMIKDSIDKASQLGLAQIKVIDNLINILKDVQDIMNDERAKLDRIVRYYEKTFSYYNVNFS